MMPTDEEQLIARIVNMNDADLNNLGNEKYLLALVLSHLYDYKVVNQDKSHDGVPSSQPLNALQSTLLKGLLERLGNR